MDMRSPTLETLLTLELRYKKTDILDILLTLLKHQH